MMGVRRRIVVTGINGQLARCMVDRGKSDSVFEIVPLGRPYLDLAKPRDLLKAVKAARPDIIVSAAAYTAVDRAEAEPELAQQINAIAPGELAKAAAEMDIPIIHLSTDYVFDGHKPQPYVETDPVAPLCVYGRTKLAGEEAVAAATDNHAILRTAWVYSPYGKNFVRTMLNLAEAHDRVKVVADQIGNPTSAVDIAEGILSVSQNLLERREAALRGVFHMAGMGSTTWAELASSIFAMSKQLGGKFSAVDPIPSSAYPTAARRPANSQLNCGRLELAHAIKLPAWKISTMKVVSTLLA